MKFASIEEKVIYEKLIAGLAEQKDALNPLPLDCIRQEDTLNLSSFSEASGINICIDPLIHTKDITSYKVLRSNRKVIGPLITFVKRVIRKLTFWYIEPICQQQTLFNNAVLSTVESVISKNNELENIVLQLSHRHAELEQNHTALEQSHTELEHRHAELEQNHTALEQKHAQSENVQQISNEQIVGLLEKMDKLNELDLEIFADTQKNWWDVETFAQTGEDVIISFIIKALGIALSDVSYLDIGANHAKIINNTYHFYKQGARGVLVEANPNLIAELKFYRHGDIVLNRCVAEKSGQLIDFYIIGDTPDSGDGLSTPSEASATELINTNPNLEISSTIKIETVSINDIIDNYFDESPTLLNIDIEGNEMEILETIDFERNRPLIIVIEMVPYMMPYKVVERNQEIIDFMTSRNYYEYAFTGINSIFIDKRQLLEQGRIAH